MTKLVNRKPGGGRGGRGGRGGGKDGGGGGRGGPGGGGRGGDKFAPGGGRRDGAVSKGSAFQPVKQKSESWKDTFREKFTWKGRAG